MIKNTRHRVKHEIHQAAEPGAMEDVFDGDRYCRLRNAQVNEHSEYKFFDNPDDIAIGLGTDGFSMFKRRHTGNSTAWPLILVKYNLHPSIWNWLENVICVGVIPGPKESSKVASQEDQIDGDGAYFVLHAFLIIIFGDIPAISKLLLLKGHNRKSACRACLFQGTPHVGDNGNVTYYVPLATPNRQVVQLPEDLPMRGHNTFLFYYDALEAAERGARAELQTECGLNAQPLFTRLKSIDLSSCALYELMHLFLENLVLNMLMHWKGTFKSIADDPAYRISAQDWKTIGELTEQALWIIPGQFAGTLPNIGTDMGLYKAEAFSFWFMYLAPILLNGQLARTFRHFLAMCEIFIWCLNMKITPEQVNELEIMIREWVQEYKRLYYRYKHDQLIGSQQRVHYAYSLLGCYDALACM
ncbi:Transposase family tnp2 [Ceratobasidium sp. AG-Ba]|nr:Transposase family tnp2 [Ceratobasidium sp. AG-Ba]